MSKALKQLLSNIDKLTAHEKAMAAHCLLFALETTTDDNVEEDWISLAEKRSEQIETGAVKTLSWSEIKEQL